MIVHTKEELEEAQKSEAFEIIIELIFINFVLIVEH